MNKQCWLGSLFWYSEYQRSIITCNEGEIKHHSSQTSLIPLPLPEEARWQGNGLQESQEAQLRHFWDGVVRPQRGSCWSVSAPVAPLAINGGSHHWMSVQVFYQSKWGRVFIPGLPSLPLFNDNQSRGPNPSKGCGCNHRKTLSKEPNK